MNTFVSNLKDTMDEELNVSMTENGALGYRTSGKMLLDLNFSVASLRHASPTDITNRFIQAFYEDRMTAMKWLFFARDIRGGLGERRLFRIILEELADSHPECVGPVVALVPEYGRWDDLWCLLTSSVADQVLDLIARQLAEDIKSCEAGDSISLLAKWLPRNKASSHKAREYAKIIQSYLNMTAKEYQHTVSSLCQHLKVVEQMMSQNRWGEISYEGVPSRANLIYNKAFLRHDEDRRSGFLDKLKNGETKINAGTLYPHDIVNKYRNCGKTDVVLEELWKAMPDTVQGCGNTLVVGDESASMTWVTLPGSSARPLEVAEALAIYFSERSSGQFKDTFMTFAETPRLIELGKAQSLFEKLRLLRSGIVGGSTNIEAVFDLVLETAINNNMCQSDLPQNILIISDMEFNDCATCGHTSGWNTKRPSARLFDVIDTKYKEAGYLMPRLVFWNVASRSGTIPVKENELGVALVSGFSPNIARMVMSGKLDPYECLLEQLNTQRYEPVEAALRHHAL